MQQAVDAVANPQFVLERLDVNVRRAQRKRVAENLVDEADDARVFGGLIEIAVVLAVVRDDLKTFLLFEQVERVRTDAEMFLDLALQGRAGREDGLELEVGKRLEAVQPRRGEQSAERDLDVPVFLAQRQHLFPQEDARREARQNRTVRLDVFQRRVRQPVFAGEPLEHFLFGVGAVPLSRPSASASIAESWRLSTMRAANAARGSVSRGGRRGQSVSVTGN